jgi:uncharacterized protein YceK
MKRLVRLFLALILLCGSGCSSVSDERIPVPPSGKEYDCEAVLKEKTPILTPSISGHDVYFVVGFREPFVDQDVWYRCVYQGVTWYVVRGALPNPTYDNQHYWYTAAGKYSMVRALGVPNGRHHFRLCVNLDPTGYECLKYSEDVMLEIE